MRSKLSRSTKAKRNNQALFEMLEGRMLLSSYYVAPTGSDTGAGTLNDPWRTLQKAVNSVATGDVVNMRGGTYSGGVSINKAGITVQNYNNETVKISSPNTDSSVEAAVRLGLDAKNVTLKGLDISGGYYYTLQTLSNWDSGDPVEHGTSGLKIINCKLHDSGRDVVKLTPGSDNITISGTEIYNSGRRDASNAEGIDGVNADNFVLRDSYIHDCTTNGVYLKGGSINTVIERNRVEDIAWSGIILGQDTDYEWFDRKVNPNLYESIDGVVRNNVVVNCKGAGVAAWAALRPTIANNTLVNVAQTMFGGILVVGQDHYLPPDYSTPHNRPSTDVTITNNLISLSSSRPVIEIRDGGLTGKLTTSNNRYYRTNGAVQFSNSPAGIYGGFSQWASAMGDTGSSEGNPQIDSSYKPTSSSPLIDAGKNLTLVTDDYAGAARPAGKSTDIGAFEYGATGSNPSPTPTPDPTPTPTPDPVQNGSWSNSGFTSQTGDFTVEFDATPTAAGSDVIIGLSNGAADWYSKLSGIVRFNTNNTIDARNGDAYTAGANVGYTAGKSYHFKMVVRTGQSSYDIYVTPQGGQQTLLGQNYKFRTEQIGVATLNNLAKFNEIGDATVKNLAGAAAPTPEPTPDPTPTPEPTPVGTWKNSAIATQSGDFQVEFDAAPTVAGSDVVIGLSSGPADWYTRLAGIVRFNANNTIDARNGSSYTAGANVGYTAGTNYHFRLVMRTGQSAYDVYVTPQGGKEVMLGQNYQFRTEQVGVPSLNNLAKFNETGDALLNNVVVTPLSSPAPTPTPSPTPQVNGLYGEYFDNTNFTSKKGAWIDYAVDFNWGTSAPSPKMDINTFSARWTGQVMPRYTETYTFHVQADDGVRLWVDGKLLIDSWYASGTRELSGKIALQAGKKYDIKLEYYDNTGSAGVKLMWSSASQAKQVIPNSRLFAPADSVLM